MDKKTISKLKKEYDNGKSLSDLSKKFLIPQSTIHYNLRKIGAVRNPQKGLELARKSGKIKTKKKILNDIDLLLKEADKKSISQIAEEYKTSRRAISKRLKENGFTPRRWHKKTTAARIKKFEQSRPQLRDPAWLRENYKTKSITDLATELNCSSTAIRSRLKEFSIPIRPQKLFSKGQKANTSRGRVVLYKSTKSKKREITFKSILECGYAMLLDNDTDVISWDYEFLKIPYFDGFTGKQRTYICDFAVQRKSGYEHIEVKPPSQQQPLDKYLYAKNGIVGWRFTSSQEVDQSYKLFKSGTFSNQIKFRNTPPSNKKYWNLYAKTKNTDIPPDWRIRSRQKYGAYYILRLVNDKRPAKITKQCNFDINRALDLIKKDYTLKDIAIEFEVDPRTITSHLEKRSYVIKWGTSRRHNQIRHATKLIWPPENIIPKQPIKKKNHWWDSYNWLHEHYVDKKLSTHKIGKLVGKSGRLIGKKLAEYNIPRR